MPPKNTEYKHPPLPGFQEENHPKRKVSTLHKKQAKQLRIQRKKGSK